MDWTDGSSSSATSSLMAVTVLPLEKAKSIYCLEPFWVSCPIRKKFMQKDECLQKEVYCKLCKQSLLYKGNTTNMIVHLQSHH